MRVLDKAEREDLGRRIRLKDENLEVVYARVEPDGTIYVTLKEKANATSGGVPRQQHDG